MREQQFATSCPVRVEVRVASGDLHVTGHDGGESTVTLEGSEKLIEATRVELVGDRLVIEQRRHRVSFLGRWDEPLRIEAHVPHGSRVEIVTAAADATLEGRFAALEMKSASGGVALTGEVEGEARVETVSGQVRLPRVAGELTVRTVSGDVEAQSVGGSVSVKSVSGDLRVGSIREGTVTVRNVSGDVELGIAPGTAIDVDARSASGELGSDVPLSDTPGSAGGPIVVIRGNTVSGNFRIFRAADPTTALSH